MAPPDLVAPTPAPAAAWTHRVDLRGRRRASRCTHTRTPAAKPRSTAPPDTKQPPSTAHPWESRYGDRRGASVRVPVRRAGGEV